MYNLDILIAKLSLPGINILFSEIKKIYCFNVTIFVIKCRVKTSEKYLLLKIYLRISKFSTIIQFGMDTLS